MTTFLALNFFKDVNLQIMLQNKEKTADFVAIKPQHVEFWILLLDEISKSELLNHHYLEAKILKMSSNLEQYKEFNCPLLFLMNANNKFTWSTKKNEFARLKLI